MPGAAYTPAEDALLREHYGKLKPAEMAALLGRSYSSVVCRVSILGIYRRPRWTESEDAIIRNNWGYHPLSRIAKLVGRSAVSVYWRAKQIGLRPGCPNGFEYFAHAAERTGYTRTQLRAILDAAGVQLKRSVCRPDCKSTRPHRFVDPLDVDDAVAKWHALELAEAAARRLNLKPRTLRRWLREARAAGVEMPAEPERQAHWWRIPTATIDSVVAERRRHETVAEAARRHGVSVDALKNWLTAAGVQRRGGRWWLVLPEVADAVVASRMAMRKCGERAAQRRCA